MKSIIQTQRYRQSLIKYAAKYGVTKAAIEIIKYDASNNAPLTGATFLVERDNSEWTFQHANI